jgi:hypothetical protein
VMREGRRGTSSRSVRSPLEERVAGYLLRLLSSVFDLNSVPLCVPCVCGGEGC